ncbi:hypothetical protein Dsi01nite_099390 [Dactylosporangium siamense]|uniref:Uncharacterized protein n=1 Tax=Dactylosporangium siamense TaxID=685454 RepID=A0A919UIQ2_9ACTN|nr:hypothetical protein Dsi01nite_099390 [Dactylosporangium siamense]
MRGGVVQAVAHLGQQLAFRGAGTAQGGAERGHVGVDNHPPSIASQCRDQIRENLRDNPQCQNPRQQASYM